MSDASKDGLSFVLSHDADQCEIIWMGSHVLTLAEANYSNIECEALAIVEAVKYFHQFLARRHFIIRSDHASLKFIFNSKNNPSVYNDVGPTNENVRTERRRADVEKAMLPTCFRYCSDLVNQRDAPNLLLKSY